MLVLCSPPPPPWTDPWACSTAYRNENDAYNTMLDVYSNKDDNYNWMIPVLVRLSNDLRIVAEMVPLPYPLPAASCMCLTITILPAD